MGTTRRRIEQFLANPSSVRYAVGAIISVTVFAVLVGALAVYLFDNSEYPTFGKAVWFTLQTVTTVGYGDVTPLNPIGRIVAAVVMLTSIGLITIVTAAITSTFVAAAARRDPRAQDLVDDDVERGLAELALRLDRIERALGVPADEPADDQPD